MSYTSYESASNECLRMVESLCRHVARDNGKFSEQTVPTLAVVERYITTAYYWVVSKLAERGYDSEQTETEVVGLLQTLNAYQAAIAIELSLPTNDESGTGNARFQALIDMRDSLYASIESGALGQMGASSSSNTARQPLVTGVSISRKQVAEDDTDATQHRIRRGAFEAPGNPLPYRAEVQE